MARLTDVYKPFSFAHSQGLDAIENQEVIITDVRFTNGRFGPIAIMAVTTGDGQTKTIVTGATVVLPALRQAKEQGLLPINARFYRKDRYWVYE